MSPFLKGEPSSIHRAGPSHGLNKTTMSDSHSPIARKEHPQWQEAITSPGESQSALGAHWKDWGWSWSSSALATWCAELTHWKRPWCWEGLGAGGEGDDRGWDGWLASPTRWTWVWAGSGRQWRSGKPSMLQSLGSQGRTRLSDWTGLNWDGAGLLVLRSSWAGCGREQGGQGQASSCCNKEGSRCVQTAIWRRSCCCSVASLLLGSCSWRLLSPRRPSQLGICRAPLPTGPAGGLRQVAQLTQERMSSCFAWL